MHLPEYAILPPAYPAAGVTVCGQTVELPLPGDVWRWPDACALLVVTDRQCPPSAPDAQAAALCDAAQSLQCSRVWADFERAPSMSSVTFLQRLCALLQGQGRELLVPLSYAAQIPAAARTICWHPADGPFVPALEAACAHEPGRGVYLDFAPVCCQITLPGAQTHTLQPQAMADAVHNLPVYHNAPLGCHYALCRTGTSCTLYLFDTCRTLAQKQRLLADLPLCGLLRLQPELDALRDAALPEI